MRRLSTLLAVAGLVAAVWAIPALAAKHPAYGKATKKGAYATATKTTATKKKAMKKGAVTTAKTRHTAATADLLDSALAPSVPADPMLDGAKPGALPWVLTSGKAIVADGRIQVHLDGFLIPGKGVGPVKTVTASLYCNGSSKPAVTTAAAPLSSAGSATIDAMATLPKTCLVPAVLVHPNGQADSYVAASGWKR